MKQVFFSITMILVAAIYSYAQTAADTGQEAASGVTTGIDIDAEKQRSMEVVKAFTNSLQAELKKGMKEGGPTNAVSVCNIKADVIARDVSQKQGLTIKRVSLKNRNPDNAPNEWQKKVLEDFEQRKLSGEPMAQITYTDVAETGTGTQFRFMKAIPTKAICILCHGENIGAEVKEKLDRLYPDDKARGFRPGDIRGAFVVIRDFSK